MQQNTENVEKTVFALKLVWLGLMAAVVVYGMVLVVMGKTALIDQKQVFSPQLKSILLVIASLSLGLSFAFRKKFLRFITASSNKKAPFTHGMSDEEKYTLRYFGKFTIYYVLMWALNECAAIIGFFLTMISGNILYFLFLAFFSIFNNAFFFRPDYMGFLKEKESE